MALLSPDVPEITEELLLGRTLIEQGHLGTAQRVLVKLCRQHPDNAEAFRGLGDVLHRKATKLVRGSWLTTPKTCSLPWRPNRRRSHHRAAHARAEALAARADLVTPQVEPVNRQAELVTPQVVLVSAAAGLMTMASPGGPAGLASTPDKGARPGAKSGKWKYLTAAAGLVLLAGAGLFAIAPTAGAASRRLAARGTGKCAVVWIIRAPGAGS